MDLIQYLIQKRELANRRWMTALKRKGYPPNDDLNDEENHLSPAQVGLIRWANAWRVCVNECEVALLQIPEVKAGLVTGVLIREEPTFFVSSSKP